MKTFRIGLCLSIISLITLQSCKKECICCGPNSTEAISKPITITLQPGANHGNDAYISNYPAYLDLNFGSNPSTAAVTWTASGTFYIGRSLFEFDLSTIPAGSNIFSARLSLFNDPTSSQNNGEHSTLNGSNQAYLRRITSNWDETTVTWNNQPATTKTNEVILEGSSSLHQDYIDIDVLSLVKDMKSNSSFGFMLSLETEQEYRALIFSSSDHSSSSKHPKLVITYQ